MILYKETKAIVSSPNVDTDYFDIVAGVLQGDTFAQFLFIICQENILQRSIDLMKENSLTLKKKKKKQQPRSRYLTETITDADNMDDLALPANTPAQAKSLLLSLKLEVSVSTWNQKKQSSWVLNEMALSSHYRANF